MPAKDCMLEEVDDNVSIVSSSQEKRRMASFTSLAYRQEEIADCGDANNFPAIPPFMPWTPSVTLPKVTPQATPKGMLQSSPN